MGSITPVTRLICDMSRLLCTGRQYDRKETSDVQLCNAITSKLPVLETYRPPPNYELLRAFALVLSCSPHLELGTHISFHISFFNPQLYFRRLGGMAD